MAAKNYTPIDHLLKKAKETSSAPPLFKEAEPVRRVERHVEIDEVGEHEPEEKVKPFVESRREIIELPEDLKKLGVESTAQVQFPTYRQVKLPLRDERVFKGLEEPITSSFRWLAELALYLLKTAHLTLKQIHGRVVRVIVR